MNIINIKFDDLKKSLLTGGYIFEVVMDIHTIHYVWMNKVFVKGLASGDGKIEIPIDTAVPNLFILLEMAERLGVEPTVYRVKSLAFTGLGVAFHDVTKD